MPDYFINEFRIESEVPLFADSLARPTGEREPITIRRASLADIPCLLRKIRRQLVYDVGDGFLVEPHGDVAVHLDFKAQTITLDASDERLPVALAWAMHAGMGAATLAHSGLPLHGAGMEIDGRYFALLADSGVGKSTLSWYLLQNGFRFGSDDLVPVRMTGESVTAYPAISLYPRLERAAADENGLDISDLLPADYGTDEEAYFVPITQERRVVEAHTLNAVFVLRPVLGGGCGGDCETCSCAKTDDLAPDEIVPRRLTGAAATQALLRNLHAVGLIGKWINQTRLTALCAEVAGRVPVYELRYRRSFGILPMLTRMVRELA